MIISTEEINDLTATLENLGVSLAEPQDDELKNEKAAARIRYADMNPIQLEDEINELESEFKKIGLRIFEKNERGTENDMKSIEQDKYELQGTLALLNLAYAQYRDNYEFNTPAD